MNRLPLALVEEGEVVAHELHPFSALSARGQNSDANDELLYRDPNPEGE